MHSERVLLTAANASGVNEVSLSAKAVRAIAIGLSLLFSSSTFNCFRHSEPLDVAAGNLFTVVFASANLFIILTSASDFVAAITGEATCFNCGNFGFLGERLPDNGPELIPDRVIDIFREMGKETEI